MENARPFTWNQRPFLRAEVPRGDNRGKIFTIAQPLAQRYEIVDFYASGGLGLILEGRDLRTQGRVLIKCGLFYDVIPYAKVRDQEGFTNQLRLPRKTLEMERRILVLLRNAGCNAVPHPNDFVYDGGSQGVEVQRSGHARCGAVPDHGSGGRAIPGASAGAGTGPSAVGAAE